MSIIAINNIFILLSIVATVIGIIGGERTKANYGSKWFEFFEALSYTGVITFIIFLAIRGVIFLGIGG